MAARRLAASAVDWAAFVERVYPNQMESFRAFKAKSDTFIAKYVTYTMFPGSSINIGANRPTVGRLVRWLAGRQFLHRAADWSRSLDVIQLADIGLCVLVLIRIT